MAPISKIWPKWSYSLKLHTLNVKDLRSNHRSSLAGKYVWLHPGTASIWEHVWQIMNANTVATIDYNYSSIPINLATLKLTQAMKSDSMNTPLALESDLEIATFWTLKEYLSSVTAKKCLTRRGCVISGKKDEAFQTRDAVGTVVNQAQNAKNDDPSLSIRAHSRAAWSW